MSGKGWLICALTVSAVILLTRVPGVVAGTLVINADTSDPAPRAAFEQLVADFQKDNPDVQVQLTVYDHEAFKPAIRLFLIFDAPDVVTWYAGERMAFFVDQGLFEDVSDIWDGNDLKAAMASSLPEMTVNGKQYGVPYTHYQWGVYYRKDIFEQHGLAAPQTWEAFLQACQTLKIAGVTPLTIGTKPLWPGAGWFDYLDFRINGLEFHRQLMAGAVPYTDPRVRRVFEHWRPLLDNGYFVPEHRRYTWQEALGLLIEGKAAMTLIGNFAVPFFKDAGVVDQIGFFPFPVIDPNQPSYEDAPTDTVHIPVNAANKADARRFLAFIAQPDQQTRMNAILGQLPANQHARVPQDRFLAAGHELLGGAAGLAQFYDRDTPPEMAQIGMLGFRKFMEEPDRLDFILERLEIKRRGVFDVRSPPASP